MGRHRDLSNPIEVYLRLHPGVTRGSLFGVDPALYHALRRQCKDSIIPLAATLSLTEEDIGEDPLGYYEENHGHISREDLEIANPVLYSILERRGELEKVPPRLLLVYRKKYGGLSPEQLKKKDAPFYRSMERAGLLEKLSEEAN